MKKIIISILFVVVCFCTILVKSEKIHALSDHASTSEFVESLNDWYLSFGEETNSFTYLSSYDLDSNYQIAEEITYSVGTKLTQSQVVINVTNISVDISYYCPHPTSSIFMDYSIYADFEISIDNGEDFTNEGYLAIDGQLEDVFTFETPFTVEELMLKNVESYDFNSMVPTLEIGLWRTGNDNRLKLYFTIEQNGDTGTGLILLDQYTGVNQPLFNFKTYLDALYKATLQYQGTNSNLGLYNNYFTSIDNLVVDYGLLITYGNINVLNPIQDVNFVDFIVNSVGSFLDFEILPGLSLTAILNLIICIGLVMMFLRFFAGG